MELKLVENWNCLKYISTHPQPIGEKNKNFQISVRIPQILVN